MAESNKAEKIAAAKKKLKQFQLKSKTEVPTENAIPTQDMSNSVVCTNGNTKDAVPINEIDVQAIDGQNFNAIHTNVAENAVSLEPTMGTVDSNAIPYPANVAAHEVHQFIQPELNHYHIPAAYAINQSHSAIPQAPPATNVEMANALNAQSAAEISQLKAHNEAILQSMQLVNVENHELKSTTARQLNEINELRIALQRSSEHYNVNQKMQQELESHIKTVNILVGEKAELVAKLQSREQSTKDSDSQIMELQGRLKASRFRVAELEKDIGTITQLNQKNNGIDQNSTAHIEQLTEENKRLQKLLQDACDDNTENHHQLVVKTKEIDSMKNVLNAKNNELEMLRIRLQQLNDTDMQKVVVDDQSHPTEQRETEMERQVIELQNMISEITNDRDRIEQQYKTYVKHLTSELGTTTQRVEELTKQNEKLAKREESLVDHIRDLEKQIQKQISTQQRLAALKEDGVKPPTVASADKHIRSDDATKSIQTVLDECQKQIVGYRKALEDSNGQMQSMQHQLNERDSKIALLESDLERKRIENPDMSGVLAEIESGKVAASRALIQNQELKEQLEEIQKAYIQVSNDKLELTNQLQSEQYTNQDVRARFSSIETELKAVKEKLFYKDEEMIRLTHVNAQLDSSIAELTEKLNHDSEEDQANNSSDIIEQEKDHHGHNHHGHDHTGHGHHGHDHHGHDHSGHDHHGHDHSGHDHGHDHSEHDHHHQTSHTHSVEKPKCNSSTADGYDHSDTVSVTSTINIATNEAMDKLQERFKRTMTEIADLTEEKQRLEHLVTQLQNETETIGEYIALYQTQRRLLKQREIEKDIQLHRIAADREEMKERLQELNKLVELLLLQEGLPDAKQLMESLRTSHSPQDAVQPINNDITSHSGGASVPTTINTSDQQQIDGSQQTPIDKARRSESHATANKIINLLTEIKDKNLSNDLTASVSIQHCSCCSGKLEVV